MLEERVLDARNQEHCDFKIARVRDLQKQATPGRIAMLAPESRACIEAASQLYCGIVDEEKR
jgi:phytoene synthase